ncbi:MAG: hypothetical protein KAQ98_13780 [Bacteriovoracaceae bacterium]|nr:hypothetical protein [Bacteriovoracaceae bacterium]
MGDFSSNGDILAMMRLTLLILMVFSLLSCDSRKVTSTKVVKSNGIRIFLLDSMTCHEDHYRKFKNLTFTKVDDARTFFPCDQKVNERNRMVHAHFVLDSFLRELNTKIRVEIVSWNVFDGGERSLKRWKQGLALSSEKNADIILSASGYSLSPGENLDDPYPEDIISIFAAGSWGTGLPYGVRLWPQINKTGNMILVGDAIISSLTSGKGFLYNSSLLNKEKIDFFIPLKRSHKRRFGGSSMAASIFAARAINSCHKYLGNKNGFKECISENSSELTFVTGQKGRSL